MKRDTDLIRALLLKLEARPMRHERPITVRTQGERGKLKAIQDVAVFTALIFAVTACATVGHDIDLSQANQLKAGVATKEDATHLFGQPTTVSENSNGNSVYLWSYAHANGVTGSSQGKSLMLVFDRTGHLTQKTTTGTAGTTGK
jgi:hypothetical protein